MKTIVVMLFILFAGLCLAGPAAQPGDAGEFGDLKTKITEWMRMTKVPGMSVSIIEEGKIRGSYGFGVKKNGQPGKVTPDTIFEACSLSKPVFAYAVLKLVDQGKLDLDMPLMGYVNMGYVEESYLKKKLSAAAAEDFKQITARQVLSHRCGLPNWRRKHPPALLFKPGEKFSYSGEGFVYLQKVVEKITRQSLEIFMKHTVFEPLGMTDSSYTWRRAYDGRFAVPHDMMGQPGRKRKPTRAVSAASLQTTAPDFARLTIALLTGKGLEPGTFGQLFSKQTEVIPGTVSWGLGIGLEHAPGGDCLWHWGDNMNFKAFVLADLKTRNGMVFFANGFSGLASVHALISRFPGGTHPALTCSIMEGYGSLDSPLFPFLEKVGKKGASAAAAAYGAEAEKLPEDKKLPEGILNNLGYYYLTRKKQFPEAVEMFKLNVRLYPKSANVYDSLGEAYMKWGKKDPAIKNYKKSIELNPKNVNGKKMLEKLQKGK